MELDLSQNYIRRISWWFETEETEGKQEKTADIELRRGRAGGGSDHRVVISGGSRSEDIKTRGAGEEKKTFAQIKQARIFPRQENGWRKDLRLGTRSQTWPEGTVSARSSEKKRRLPSYPVKKDHGC